MALVQSYALLSALIDPFHLLAAANPGLGREGGGARMVGVGGVSAEGGPPPATVRGCGGALYAPPAPYNCIMKPFEKGV